MSDSVDRRATPALTPQSARDVLRRATPIDAPRPGRRSVSALRGRTSLGEAVVVRLDEPTLVLFLSGDCAACDELAALVVTGGDGLEVVGVLRDLDAAAPQRWGAGIWVIGDAAFDVFGVTSPPFFCVVGADGAVALEGVAVGASYVLEHAARALVRCERAAGAPRRELG